MSGNHPAWTFLETIDLRLCAIEYLRMIERRTSSQQYFTDTWQYWVGAHGIPDPGNWDNVSDYSQYLRDHRRRVFRTIRWHALSGRHAPSDSRTRIARIRRIQRALIADLRLLQEQRVGPDSVRARRTFEDDLGGYTLIERGVRWPPCN